MQIRSFDKEQGKPSFPEEINIEGSAIIFVGGSAEVD
jgi:hypothetical protein